ncbi:hypothetical protein [Glutamicibacter ardleyensis]|uniref:hypothetical protein n=1 Tax=Glutamicibacter ardleyensis TaxID=225894 RepID=UPI003FCF6EC6
MDDKKQDLGKVAKGAVKGAVTGGLTGAVKGTISGALKTKKGKRALVFVVSLVLIGALGITFFGYVIFTSILGQETEASTDNAKNQMSLATMNTEVEDKGSLDTVMSASGDIQWEIMVALWKTQKTSSGGYGDYQLTKDAVSSKKITEDDAESLERATVYVAKELQKQLSESSDKGVPNLDSGLMESYNSEGEWVRSIGTDDGSKASAEYAKTAFTTAITKLPLEGIKDRADEIYRLAMGWRTGTKGAPIQEDNAPVCTPGDGSTSGVKIPEKYLELVKEASKISGLSVELLGSQLQAESSWNPLASSGVAFGIAQFRLLTWAEFGKGDIWNPDDAIPAFGRYMKYIKEKSSKYAKGDEELLARMALFGYHNGPFAISNADGDFEKALSKAPKGKAYVEKIMKASKGKYSADCKEDDGGGTKVAEGTIVETAGALAWDHYVDLKPHSMSYAYGKAQARPEFVEASSKLSKAWNTAYFTDCGVFVATVMRTSGADPTFPKRGTGTMMSYLQNSNKYEFFRPGSEADLEPGDILILHGHIYFYTGKRNDSPTGRAQGASLSARPPSGHYVYLSDSRGAYNVARLKGQK